MFLLENEAQRLSAELRGIVNALRAVPEQAVQIGTAFGNEVRSIRQRRNELREEVVQQLLLQAQERAQTELEQIRATLQERAERAKALANRLATSWQVPSENVADLLMLNIETRQLELVLDLSNDEALAKSLRQLAKSASERQALLAWCWLTGFLDAHPDWKLSESAWRELRNLLPPDYRTKIVLVQEIAEGTERALQALLSVSRYIRNEASTGAFVPLWRDGAGVELARVA